MSDNREFIEEFLVESSENLDQLDKDLLALEADPTDPQRLASVFRTVHTIKGNSGFFGFSKLGALAHSGEHLLGKLRDGKLRLDDRVAGGARLQIALDLRARLPEKPLLQFARLDGDGGRQVLRRVELRPVALVAEAPDLGGERRPGIEGGARLPAA